MFSNRLESHFKETQSAAIAAASPATGFAICPLASPPQALVWQLMAMHEACRQQILAAERHAVRQVVERAAQAGN